MGADENRCGTQGCQLGEELLSILHVGVVRLVVAEERPDRFHLAETLIDVYANENRLRLSRRYCAGYHREENGNRAANQNDGLGLTCRCLSRPHVPSVE